jgi:hypothetical protein
MPHSRTQFGTGDSQYADLLQIVLVISELVCSAEGHTRYATSGDLMGPPLSFIIKRASALTLAS